MIMSWHLRLCLRLGLRLGIWGILLSVFAVMLWQLLWIWLAVPLVGGTLLVGLWEAWRLMHQHGSGRLKGWVYGAFKGAAMSGLAFYASFLMSRPEWFWPLLLALVAGSCGGYRKYRLSGLKHYLLSWGLGVVVGGAWAWVLLSLLPWLVFVLGLWSVGWLWWWILLPKLLARSWVRVLNGPLEDMCYPLRGELIKIGADADNHVVLENYARVYPFHGCVSSSKGCYRLIGDQQRSEVLVNYRQFAQHKLESGDLLKLGDALLQVGGKLPTEDSVPARQKNRGRYGRNRSSRYRGRHSRGQDAAREYGRGRRTQGFRSSNK